MAMAIDARLEFPSISATLSCTRQESSAAESPGQFRTFYVTIFQKIIDRRIPASIVHEDEHCIAFHDVNPQAPVHVLLIPRKPLVSLNDLTDSDAQLAGHLLGMVPRVAAMLGLTDGYRTVINTGDHGGQSVFHLHIHILGGRPLGWPPG
jgi:histidine triad (HIT) family protein